MRTNEKEFIGPLAKLCNKFISWKRAGGYKYDTERAMLLRFDHFTCKYSFSQDTLPRDIVESWCMKREYEHPRTHCSRIRIVKLFAQYMRLCGYDAYVTPLPSEIRSKKKFLAHIYTDSELKRIFAIIDNLNCKKYPKGYIQYPIIFRLFYSAGLRLSEVFFLKNRDVDFSNEALIIRNTKFGKTRIVPLHHEMFAILRNYIQRYCDKSPDNYIFYRNPQTLRPEKAVGKFFINVVRSAGFYHGGKSKGMRIHDFRHTFAVRSLRNAFLAGHDMTNFMPYLCAYMGHADLRGTELYLQLTADVYPEITERFSRLFSTIIPTEDDKNENK